MRGRPPHRRAWRRRHNRRAWRRRPCPVETCRAPGRPAPRPAAPPSPEGRISARRRWCLRLGQRGRCGRQSPGECTRSRCGSVGSNDDPARCRASRRPRPLPRHATGRRRGASRHADRQALAGWPGHPRARPRHPVRPGPTGSGRRPAPGRLSGAAGSGGDTERGLRRRRSAPPACARAPGRTRSGVFTLRSAAGLRRRCSRAIRPGAAPERSPPPHAAMPSPALAGNGVHRRAEPAQVRLGGIARGHPARSQGGGIGGPNVVRQRRFQRIRASARRGANRPAEARCALCGSRSGASQIGPFGRAVPIRVDVGPVLACMPIFALSCYLQFAGRRPNDRVSAGRHRPRNLGRPKARAPPPMPFGR